jgi:hypothetical protein
MTFLVAENMEPSYTAENFWRVCAAITEHKIDPNIAPPKSGEDYEDDENSYSCSRDQKKAPKPRSGDCFVEVSYTAMDEQNEFCITVHCAAVKSQDIPNGEYVEKYLFWFSQHDVEDAEHAERWYHRMWLKVLSQVGANVEWRVL